MKSVECLKAEHELIERGLNELEKAVAREVRQRSGWVGGNPAGIMPCNNDASEWTGMAHEQPQPYRPVATGAVRAAGF